MSVALELIARAAFLCFVAGVSLLGILFAGFAADSGPNSTSTYLYNSAMFFGAAGAAVALTPSQFFDSFIGKVLLAIFGISIVQPIFVLLFAG